MPSAAAAAALRLRRLIVRLVVWPLRSRTRLLTLTWAVGLVLLGSQTSAHADDLIPMPTATPDDPTRQTMFEHYDVSSYDLFFQPDANNDGLDAAGTSIMNMIENGMLALAMYLIRGALTAIYWLLGLNLYADNHDQINASITGISAAIMTPLLGMTLVIAGATAFARSHRDGGGSITGDVSWIVAGAIMALSFTMFPGDFLGVADGLRAEVATRLVSAYAGGQTTVTSQSGYTATITVNVPPNCGTSCSTAQRDLAVRQLTNSMWETYVVVPWCYLQFKQMTTCNRPTSQGPSMGVIFLDQGDKLEKVKADLDGQYDQVKNGGYPDFGGNDRWIRGQSPARFGAVLLFFLLSLAIAAFLLALILFGLMAALGLLLLVLVGPFFLMLWMIPGPARRMGMQWFASVIGVMVQSLIITLTLGGVSVLTGIINKNVGLYGYFITCLFNLVVLVAGWRMRGQLEAHIGAPMSMTSGSPISSYSAWKVVGSIGRTGSAMTRRAGRITAPVAAGAGRSATKAGTNLASRGAAKLPAPMRDTTSALTDHTRVVTERVRGWVPPPGPSSAAKHSVRTTSGVMQLEDRARHREAKTDAARVRIADRRTRNRPGDTKPTGTPAAGRNSLPQPIPSPITERRP